MDFLSFDNVSYTYPQIGEIETDENGQPILNQPVFDFFTAELPAGFTSLIGPNASGKSTFLLLAGGRVAPQQGKVRLFSEDISHATPEKRDELASFIFQNMEFETDDPVGPLLEQVFGNGFFKAGSSKKAKDAKLSTTFYNDVLKVFELSGIMDRKLNGISKGEMQRVLMAFSVLYGSRSIFMDEPMFAMEDAQKHEAMQFLRDFCTTTGTPVWIAMHELELSKKYAENVALFFPNRDIDFGSPAEVLTKDALETAYGVPAAMLRDTEALNRKSLKEAADALKAQNNG